VSDDTWINPRIANDFEAARVAQAFHEAYEHHAPRFGYKTRQASAVPWEEVPASNKALMIATVQELFMRGVIARPK
jgi:hypothetical protein